MNENPPRGQDDPSGRRQRTKRLGDHLRRMYDSVASEGAPDDFLRLLNEADRKSAGNQVDATDAPNGDKGKSNEDFLGALNEAAKSSKKD